MKNIWLLFVAVGMILLGCSKDESGNNIQLSSNKVPEKFKIDIPSAISAEVLLKSASVDEVDGKDTYEYMRNFISVGESSADIVEEIIKSTSVFASEIEYSITYTGLIDGRSKEFTVKKNVEYNGTVWPYNFIITDVDFDNIGLSFYWDKETNVGIAVLDPYYIDTLTNKDLFGTLFQIHYSSIGNADYDETMTVIIENWVQLPELAENNKFRLDNLKMFVGKKGNRVDVIGTSTHPDAFFLVEQNVGYDWSFVASANDELNIAVSELGLPPIDLDNSLRSVILGNYAVKEVIKNEILESTGYTATEQQLANANAPAYFDKDGFVLAGTAPNDSYTDLENVVKLLTPYNPNDIIDLKIVK